MALALPRRRRTSLVLLALLAAGPALSSVGSTFLGKMWLKLRSVRVPVETSGKFLATVVVSPDMKVHEFKEELQRLKWEDPEIRKRFEVKLWVDNQELLSDDGKVRAVVSRGKTVQAIFGIPEGIQVIEDEAFSGCTSLTHVTIPDSVTEIGSGAFRGCTALTHVTIPESVAKIGPFAFCGCKSLTNLTIPDSVTEIGQEAFSRCLSLTSVTIPESVSMIDREAFGTCTSLTTLIIPKSVTKIDVRAFVDCKSLTNVTIPDSVTLIGVRAFFGCSSLTAVTIPKSVMEVGAQAFAECHSESQSLTVTVPEWDESAKVSSTAFNGASVKRMNGDGDA